MFQDGLDTILFAAILAVPAVFLLGLGRLIIGPRPARPEPLDLSPLEGRFPDLNFRTLTASDVPAYQALATAPDVLAANHWTAETVEATRLAIANVEYFRAFSASTLVGVEAATGEVVGMATLGSGSAGEITIGLMVAEHARGRGFGHQILAAMITALQHRTDHPVAVLTAPTNEPVKRIMSNLGYSPDAETVPMTFPDGAEIDALRYECGRG